MTRHGLRDNLHVTRRNKTKYNGHSDPLSLYSVHWWMFTFAPGSIVNVLVFPVSSQRATRGYWLCLR